jgi:hypothetical protein
MNDETLARLVADAVADVEPADRLDDIRARTTATASTSRRHLFIAGGSVLAAAAAVVAIALVTVALNQPSAEAPPTDDPTRIIDSATPSAHAVAVYYVGDTGRGLRLFREFRNETGPADLGEALDLLSEAPLDPDYRTLWPAGAFATGEVEVRGDVIHVVIADAALHDRPASMTEDEAALALEQVIFTVQAAVGERLGVQFRLGDNPIDTVLGQPTSEPVSTADPLDVLSLMSITYPTEGAVVSGSFVAEGLNNGNEAAMNWVIEQDGEDVLSGFATAEGWMGSRLFPWRTDPIDVSGLAPGTYVFVAFNPDMSDGEGFPPDTDTRSITVE